MMGVVRNKENNARSAVCNMKSEKVKCATAEK